MIALGESGRVEQRLLLAPHLSPPAAGPSVAGVRLPLRGLLGLKEVTSQRALLPGLAHSLLHDTTSVCSLFALKVGSRSLPPSATVEQLNGAVHGGLRAKAATHCVATSAAAPVSARAPSRQKGERRPSGEEGPWTSTSAGETWERVLSQKQTSWAVLV